ncbi:hypothetical protein [Salinigranum sp.]
MSLLLTAAGDALGVVFAMALLLLPVVYVWLRMRGTLGDPDGRSLR